MGAAERQIVELVSAGDAQGFELLYGIVKNFSFFIMRQLGGDELKDKVHDVFVAAVQSIQSGSIHDPEKLIPYITTMVRYYCYGVIDHRQRWREVMHPLDVSQQAWNTKDVRCDLDQIVHMREVRNIVRTVLSELRERDHEILVRFYMKEESQEEIIRAMGLSYNQFRLMKSRALHRAAKIARRQGTADAMSSDRNSS